MSAKPGATVEVTQSLPATAVIAVGLKEEGREDPFCREPGGACLSACGSSPVDGDVGREENVVSALAHMTPSRRTLLGIVLPP